MLRAIGGTLAGIVVALVAILVIERIGHSFYPMPGEVDMRDTEGAGAALGAAPLAAKAFVVGGWMQIAAVAAPLLGGFAAHHVGPARLRAGGAA